MVWTLGGRFGRRPLPLQSHHAHCAAALPGHGPKTRGTRGQVSVDATGNHIAMLCFSFLFFFYLNLLQHLKFFTSVFALLLLTLLMCSNQHKYSLSSPLLGCCWTGRTRTTTTFSTDWIQKCSTCLFLLLLLLLQLLCAHRPPTSLPVPQKQIPRTEAPPPSTPLLPLPLPPLRTSVRYC